MYSLYNIVIDYFDSHDGLEPLIELIVLVVLLWEKGIGSFCKKISGFILRKIKYLYHTVKRFICSVIYHIFILRVSAHIAKNAFIHKCGCLSSGKNEEHHFHIIKDGFSYLVVKNYYKINPGQTTITHIKHETIFEISLFSKIYFLNGSKVIKSPLNISKYKEKYRVKGIDEEAAREFLKKFE